MPYEPFHERFPEIAHQETRVLKAINHPELSDDTYTLIEAYCNERDCDCRRVFFNVHSEKRQEIVAVIAYGWESPSFYRDWFGKDDPEIIAVLKGPALNASSPQSELAPALLETIEWVLQDQQYVSRLKQHYQIFKDVVDKRGREKPLQRVRRNDPCPCGSGQKYKHCCMNLD